MQKFSTIVSVRQLFENNGDPNWVIVDCRFDISKPDWGFEEYQHGHIPGAVYANINQDLSSTITPQTGRHPLPFPETFIQTASNWGIDTKKQVVVYDHLSGAYASRLWWLLRNYGHDAVAVLDGGMQAWVNSGYPLISGVETKKWADFEGIPDPNQWITTPEMEMLIKDPTFVLIDSRAPERYRGEIETIDSVAGHIPGAINRFYHENLTNDGYFLPGDQLRQAFEAISGEIPPDHTIMYCGSGVTACMHLLAMEIAGLYGAKLYAGSWSEWIRDLNRPIAIGE
jgi:thiosulfate/3-mercaptopyruvate sulfurtransferase